VENITYNRDYKPKVRIFKHYMHCWEVPQQVKDEAWAADKSVVCGQKLSEEEGSVCLALPKPGHQHDRCKNTGCDHLFPGGGGGNNGQNTTNRNDFPAIKTHHAKNCEFRYKWPKRTGPLLTAQLGPKAQKAEAGDLSRQVRQIEVRGFPWQVGFEGSNSISPYG
jgi:hypothetical protein